MSVKDLVRQAYSSRIKHAYNALIEIRKKHTKSTGVQSLVDAGLVRRLVELVRTRDSLPENYRVNVVDISLSILANMCMEEVARAKVLKTDGVTELGELFLESDSKTLLHRSCRCLANILLSPKSWELVHGLAILEKLAELLRDTEDDDCKQTYLRTVRLLGQTPSYVGLLLENNLVCASAKHLDAENNDVKKASFRCVQSLSTHGCTAQFARQIAKSGKVGYLLSLLPEQSTDVFPLLCKLAEHEEFRPQFGNDSGIANFIQYFRSADEPYCSMRIEILNVLCLCCQESVNRMKLRENDALPIFLKSLTDEKFTVLHERIVSAFVCFMYDEKSFEILLEGGMVEIVREMFIEYMKKSSEDTEHICKSQKLAESGESVTEIGKTVKGEPENVNIVPEMEEVVFDQEEQKMETTKLEGDDQELEKEGMGTTRNVKDTNIGTTKHDKDCNLGTQINERDQNLGKKRDDTVSNSGTTSYDTETDAIGNSIDDQEHQEKQAPVTEQRKRPKYSMDSPTYESVARELREMDTSGNAHGPTCIESFTPPHTIDHPCSPYSPLSNSSYYSPSGSSPDMSSGYCSDHDHHHYGGHSPRGRSRQKRVRFSLDSSPEDDGPSRPHHKYTGMTWSPDSSPERDSTSNYEGKAVWYSPEQQDSSSPVPLGEPSGTEEEKAGCSRSLKSSSCPEFSSCKQKDARLLSVSSDALGLNVERSGMFEDGENLYSPVVSTLEFEEEYARGFEKMEDSSGLPSRPIIDAVHESSTNLETVQCDVKVESCKSSKLSQTESLPLSPAVAGKFVSDKNSETSHSKSLPLRKRTNEKRTMNRDQEIPNTTKKLIKLDLGETAKTSENQEKEVTDDGRSKTKKGKGKKRKRTTPQNKRFEMNVLQLFSRVQDINPLLYIVTLDMVTCLLDYLCNMDRPLTRVAKILSRALRDRLCFEKILKLNIPVLIFDKLLPDQCLPGVVSELVNRRMYSTRMPHWPEIFEFVQPNSLVTERFSMSEGSRETEYNPSKRSRYAESEKGCVEPWKSEAVHNSDICSLQKCQVALLEDLRTVIDTQFGCGGIERIVLTSPDGLPREVSACLPLLSWSKESRKFYFKQLDIIEQLLKELEASPSELLTTIALGFGFLARTSNMGTKYSKPFSNHSNFTRENEGLCNKSSSSLMRLGKASTSESTCKVDMYVPTMDEQFVVFLTDDGKVTASRTVLTERSEFFAAMLTGRYKESNQAEISLPETSKFTLTYLIHYTYGCGSSCAVISHLNTSVVSLESVKCCTDLLAEADKHLLSDLHENLVKNVIGRFIVPDCTLPLFEYAVVSDNVELQKAAVGSLLADSDLTEICGLFSKFLESKYSQVFIQTLYEILTDW